MKIHILAISGSKTTPLALCLKKQGHIISGSDQKNIFPPFSTILKKNHIPVNQNKINHSIDLAIIGNAYQKFPNCQREFEEIKKKHIPYISYTQYIVKNLIKQNSILVAGAYGKSTITALLSYIFAKQNYDPSYMFGASAINKIASTRFGQSSWSIIEADENHTGLDTKTTFLYYPVKYLILTSTQWEHKDSYQNYQENQNAFVSLIQKVPSNGFIVYNQLDPSIQPLLKFANCPCIPYSLSLPTNHLFGQANQNNLAAVDTFCQQLHIKNNDKNTFLGLKRRLQLVATIKNTFFYDDFAQSPHRIKEALLSLSQKFPKHRILVLFEPHASFLQHQQSLAGLDLAFKPAQKIFLSKITFSATITKNNRTTQNTYKQLLGDKLIYLPLCSNLVSQITSYLKKGDILIRFSSGGLSGQKTFNKIIKICRATL